MGLDAQIAGKFFLVFTGLAVVIVLGLIVWGFFVGLDTGTMINFILIILAAPVMRGIILISLNDRGYFSE